VSTSPNSPVAPAVTVAVAEQAAPTPARVGATSPSYPRAAQPSEAVAAKSHTAHPWPSSRSLLSAATATTAAVLMPSAAVPVPR